MSHQDRKSEEQIVIHHESIKQAVNSLFTARVFQAVKVRRGSRWTARILAVTALFWAWSMAEGLKERFQAARKLTGKIFRWLPDPGETYNGFLKQLRKWHVELQVLCIGELRLHMQQDLFGQWEMAGFVVIAGDGSRIELPRTQSNEAAYSPKRKKKGSPKRAKDKRKASRGKRWRKAKRQSEESIRKKANSPQMWLTLFWHVGTGLPWAWRTGPSDSSERQHLEEMLPELPKNTLITADAGFMGYEFWSAVMAAGHCFVIRSGANVRLLKKLGFSREYENTVYLWPDWARKGEQPPLALRAVWVHDGKQPMCLITNVLSKGRLSDRQILQIYKARWGIEVFHAHYDEKDNLYREDRWSYSECSRVIEVGTLVPAMQALGFRRKPMRLIREDRVPPAPNRTSSACRSKTALGGLAVGHAAGDAADVKPSGRARSSIARRKGGAP